MECLYNIAWGWEKETILRFIGYASKNHKQTIRYTFKLNKKGDSARRIAEILDIPFDELNSLPRYP